jgi:hypothetical protein
MRKRLQDKDDSKEKNKTMMIKNMKNESQDENDGEDFATTQKGIQ